MSTRENIIEIIDELIESSRLYYEENEDSPLTDEEFDAKQTYLLRMSDQNEYKDLFSTGSKGEKILEGDVLLGSEQNISSDKEIIRKIPMLSLQKAKKEKDVKFFLNKMLNSGAKNFRLQAKLDGSANSVIYKNGKISSISSRGDGTKGERRNYLLNAENLLIKGMPEKIDETKTFEVRGEIFFTHQQFINASENRLKATGAGFENPRNAVSGLLKRVEKGLSYPVEMSFVVYSLVIDDEIIDIKHLPKDFISIDALTEELANNVKLTSFENADDVYRSIQDFGKVMPSFNVPTDGVVIKPTNEAELYKTLGSTGHHPSSQIAWKYPSEQVETRILQIRTTVGRTGRLTPVADIEPVYIDGSKVSKASLHNFNYLYRKNIRQSSLVLVEKANEIIPQVVAVIENPDSSYDYPIPTTCPICNEKLKSKGSENPPKTLLCANYDCPARDIASLITAVERTRLDIDGLSEAILTQLNNTGKVNTIADLYELTIEDLTDLELGKTVKGNVRQLGQKNAEKIYEQIQQSKKAPLENVLSALNINHLGRRASKTLVEKFHNLHEIQQLSVDELASVDGFSHIKASAIVEGLKHRKNAIDKMIALGVKFEGSVKNSEENSEVDLSGLSFAISGTVPEPFGNRNDFIDYIERNNGEFHSAPKSSTSYMVGENSGSSSKIKKAVSLGIEFISPADFTAQFVS